MINFQFLRKVRKYLLSLLAVYLFCCQHALSQELATAEDFRESPNISADGRYRAVLSFLPIPGPLPSRSVRLSLYDANSDTTVLLNTSVDSIIYPQTPTISGDGKFIAFHTQEFDGNSKFGLYRYDVDTGETILVNLDGPNTSPFYTSISPDGRYISYTRGNISGVQNRLQLFDSLDSTLITVNAGCSASHVLNNYPAISADGYLAYHYRCGDDKDLVLYNIEDKSRTVVNIDNIAVTSYAISSFSENSQYLWFQGYIYDRNLDDVYPYGTSGDCIDSDGDGWGFNEYLGESCLVDQNTQTGCDYSDADLYGGWGWNAATNQSCEPLENTISTQGTNQCIDMDSDGWGWNGSATCLVGAGTDIENNCDYSNAHLYGGWGWNAVESLSCEPLENTISTQGTNQCIDMDGDGWGWNGSESCIP